MRMRGRSWSDRLARRWSVIVLAWVLAIAAAAAFVVVLLGGNSTTVVRTVIVRTPAVSAAVTQDTPAGAVAAGQAFWDASDAAAGSVGSWTLEYRVDSYTPAAASLEGWGVMSDSSGTQWQTVTVTVRYSDGEWRPPATAAGIKVALDPSFDPSSPQFAAAIASFHRFAGAP